jgi:hypothetical protein
VGPNRMWTGSQRRLGGPTEGTSNGLGPTGQRFFFVFVTPRFEERSARWACRDLLGIGAHQGLRPWLGERLAPSAIRLTVGRDVQIPSRTRLAQNRPEMAKTTMRIPCHRFPF